MIDRLASSVGDALAAIGERASRQRHAVVCAVAFSLALACPLRSALGQATLHQLYNFNQGGVIDMGSRYDGSIANVTAADANFGPVATDGQSILLFEKESYVARLRNNLSYPASAPDPFFTPEIRIPFVGSGVDMIQLNNAAGETYEWDIIDSLSNGSSHVVASGTSSTSSAVIQSQTVNLVPSGTLPTDRIHILRVKSLNSDNLSEGAAGAKWRVILDAVGIHNDVPITYDDDSNVSGNWTYTNPGLWTIGFNDFAAYEGTRSSSAGPGETVEIEFTGTSIALLAWGLNSRTEGHPVFGTGPSTSGTFSWQVDGGALGSGVVDMSLDHNFATRWPELLINGLPSGQHTLTITNDGTPGTGMFPDNSGFTFLDALAVFDSGITTPSNANFDGVNGVDGNDLLIWQRNFGLGSGATLAQGDANADGAVNAADFNIWKTQFGTPAVAAAGAVPEPMGLSLLGLGAVLTGAGRRRGR